MVDVGKYSKLRVIKMLPIGAILDDDEGGILLPKRYLPKFLKTGDEIEVFIYRDSEDRLIATTQKPKATTGEVALLKCTSVNKFGAFLDWSLPKDLLVPFKEQKIKMEENRSYVVYIYIDDITDRIAASSKLDKYISNKELTVNEGDQVDLVIVSKTDLGYSVVINNLHWGLVFNSEVFGRIDIGMRLKGHIKTIRPDNKIDVSLQAEGIKGLNDAATLILSKLQNSDGFLALSDKSTPDEIYSMMKMSKKTYKRAVGTLYKKRLITLDEEGIRLAK